MNLKPGRVLKAGTFEAAPGQEAPPRSARIVPRLLVEAELGAAARIAEAETQARALVARAKREADAERLTLELAARAQAQADLAARAVALGEREARALERDLDRSVELAALLAERLLRRALFERPELVRELAIQALKDVQATHGIKLFAHADDVPELERLRRELELTEAALAIEPDPSLRRGDLRLQTKLGTSDARIDLQLARFAQSLRETLASPRRP